MEHNQQITARVTPIENESKLKGIATVTIGDQISVHGVKILEKPDGTLGMAMPSEKGKDGKFYETALPANKDAYATIKEAVMAAYKEAVLVGRPEKTERNPTDVTIVVGSIRENPNGGAVKGDCQVTVNDALIIKGVKIITTKEGELSIGMPSKQNQYGEYDSIATPTNKGFFAQLKEAVVEKFADRANIIGNIKYSDLGAKEELKHTSLNSVFAEKVTAQLDEMGVNWSGKKNANNTTSVAVNISDEGALNTAIQNAKESAQTEKQAALKVAETLQNNSLPAENQEITAAKRRT
jgi:stage V sporulation protein G